MLPQHKMASVSKDLANPVDLVEIQSTADFQTQLRLPQHSAEGLDGGGVPTPRNLTVPGDLSPMSSRAGFRAGLQ